jgi:hypothetical protein
MTLPAISPGKMGLLHHRMSFPSVMVFIASFPRGCFPAVPAILPESPSA